MMYSIILKSNDEQIIRDIGKEQLGIMYKKLERAYCEVVGMKPTNTCMFMDLKSVTIYQGNVEWADY